MEKLSPEEVAVLIRARRLLREKGLSPDVDVKTICEHAGISRKTGYEWEKRHLETPGVASDPVAKELEVLKREHARLLKENDDLKFENEGRKLAWEIHDVDKYLASKKNTLKLPKGKKR